MSDSYALAGVGFFLKPGRWSSSALCSTAYAAVKIDSEVFATSGGKRNNGLSSTSDSVVCLTQGQVGMYNPWLCVQRREREGGLNPWLQ